MPFLRQSGFLFAARNPAKTNNPTPPLSGLALQSHLFLQHYQFSNDQSGNAIPAQRGTVLQKIFFFEI
jgi:hypothetical protein